MDLDARNTCLVVERRSLVVDNIPQAKARSPAGTGCTAPAAGTGCIDLGLGRSRVTGRTLAGRAASGCLEVQGSRGLGRRRCHSVLGVGRRVAGICSGRPLRGRGCEGEGPRLLAEQVCA